MDDNWGVYFDREDGGDGPDPFRCELPERLLPERGQAGIRGGCQQDHPPSHQRDGTDSGRGRKAGQVGRAFPSRGFFPLL